MKNRHIVAIALFVGLIGSFLSMLEWGFNRFGMLSFQGMGISGLADGFMLLFNRLFTISQQRQAYRYTMFVIASPESYWDGHIALALVVVAMLFGALCAVLAYWRNKTPVVITMILVIAAQVYFGVFPAGLWNILLFASFVLVLMRGAELRNIVAIVIAVAFIAMGTWATYSGTNPRLLALSESIRDQFDIRVSQITGTPIYTHNPGAQPDNRDLSVTDVQEETLHDAHHQDYDILYDERARGAEIGALSAVPSLLPLLLIILAILAVIGIYKYLPMHLRVYKRRKMFDTAGCQVAINDMFIYMLEWLFAHGLERKNIVFSAYGPQLSMLVSQEYAVEYENTIALWRKAVYSGHPPSEAERAHMKAFMHKTMDIVWKKSNISTKARIKFHYYL